jgi:GNAT superfamily N-acetyltransferase
MKIEILPAYEHLDMVRDMFTEYVTMLGVDLSFQNYADEFANLPGKYAPPEGGLFLAHCDGQPAGCVGLRKFADTICEMKRLYVRPEYRGLKIGFALVEKVILAGKDAGYNTMVLDTLASLDTSRKLYYRMGFIEIPPYYHNPYPGVVYLQKELQDQ